jgi:hypothetical protein
MCLIVSGRKVCSATRKAIGELSSAFGNQTISKEEKSATLLVETHGFAPLPRGRFAFIACNLN